MEVTTLSQIWSRREREKAHAAWLHPPQVINVPLSFPFVMRPALTKIRGRHVRQQPTPLMQASAKAVDARQLRQEFQELEHSDSGLQHFLNRYGWWDGRRIFNKEEIWDFQEWLRLTLLGSTKFRAQQLSPNGLFGRLPGLLATEFSLTFGWSGSTPVFTVATHSCAAAIAATVALDVVRSIKYRKCKRPDCPVLFPSKRGKRYHSVACQHLEVVRRSRPPQNQGKRKRQ